MSARTRRLLDVALVPALAVLGVAEAADVADASAGALVTGVVCAVAMAALLAWRRRAPATVAAGELALAAVWMSVVYGWGQGPFAGFLDLVVAAFALGAHARDRRGLWVVGGLAALVIVGRDVYALAVGERAYGDAFPAWVWLGVAYAGGLAMRRRELLARLLEDRAVRAERDRERRAREAIVEERARIARELHDVIAHNVSVIVVQAQGAARVLEGDQPAVREALHAIETTGREAVDEMRRLLGVLRRGDEAPALAPRPGLAELEPLLDSVRAAGVPVRLAVEGRPAPLPAGVDVSAYRIVQEALTNMLKHAGAAHADVVVRYAAGALELEIRDDGAGAPANGAGRNGDDPSGAGHGLVGMRERVALFGGEVDAGRAPEGGWTVRARLPVGAEHGR